MEESSEIMVDAPEDTKAPEDVEEESFPDHSDPVLLNEEPEHNDNKKVGQESTERNEGTRHTIKQTKPYPYKGDPKRQKEDPTDFLEIFGKLEINLLFLDTLKLPPFSKFIKDFIAGKAKADGKIVIRESVSAVIQMRLPSNTTDPGMFILPHSHW